MPAARVSSFELQTPRLHIRGIQPSDLDDLVALDQSPEVMRFISGGIPTPREVYLGSEGLLARMCAFEGEPFGYAAAFELDSGGEAGPFVGWFHLRPSVFNDDLLEVGYRLRRDVWGRGLATEGARALSCYSVHALGYPAVDGCVSPDNAGSIRVLEKCAMRPTGSFIHPRAPIEVMGFVADAETIRRQPWFEPITAL